MRTNRSLIVLLVLANVIVACSDDNGSEKESQSGQSAGEKPLAGKGGSAGEAGMREMAKAGAGGAGSGAAGATDDGSPTFSNVYEVEFRSCRVDVCHGKGIVGLNMATKAGAYESLVNVPSSPMGKCSQLGKERVVPGEPENSLLWLKLDGVSAPCGQQMPPGGQLSQKARDRIRAWIEMGAKND